MSAYVTSYLVIGRVLCARRYLILTDYHEALSTLHMEYVPEGRHSEDMMLRGRPSRQLHKAGTLDCCTLLWL